MKYRIEVSSPRHGVRNEYFCEFRRDSEGRESIHTEPNRATWLGLDVAKIALRRLRDRQYRLRCRLLDEHGSVHDAYHDGTPDPRDSLTFHNYTENVTYRGEFEGQVYEVPLLHNLATRKFYAKLSTSLDPADASDIVSVAGATSEEVFERLTTNFHWRPYLGQFVAPPDPPLAEPVAQLTVNVSIPEGYEIVGFRPGNTH